MKGRARTRCDVRAVRHVHLRNVNNNRETTPGRSVSIQRERKRAHKGAEKREIERDRNRESEDKGDRGSERACEISRWYAGIAGIERKSAFLQKDAPSTRPLRDENEAERKREKARGKAREGKRENEREGERGIERKNAGFPSSSVGILWRSSFPRPVFSTA